MTHVRVIYTASTSAECFTVLKLFGFAENTVKGYWKLPENDALKVYVIWGKSPQYPELLERVDFTPRVQVHLRAREAADGVERYARETVTALQDLDPGTCSRVFDPATGAEIAI